jgi:hypothetical protein
LKYLDEGEARKKVTKEGFRVTLNTFSIEFRNSTQKSSTEQSIFKPLKITFFFSSLFSESEKITFHQSFQSVKTSERERERKVKKDCEENQ